MHECIVTFELVQLPSACCALSNVKQHYYDITTGFGQMEWREEIPITPLHMHNQDRLCEVERVPSTKLWATIIKKTTSVGVSADCGSARLQTPERGLFM